MSLTPGTRFGVYEILDPLGAGGMGEVYRARDTRLDREVAIKVLPVALARDHDRLVRFEREAKVLASLNHPNIAQIYGFEESGETRALAMELVPGSTLSIPQPLETALNYARQIADALEAAHEKGFTHRDLKPANIMITPDGVVKVLDFGLAAVPGRESEGGDPNNSPTLTMAATRMGAIMGTAAYMSPEQAAGKAVDRRSDVWSYGVVLCEMLTGQRLFDGETISHTLADVLRAPIDFNKLPPSTPAPIVELVKRCLDRNLKTRLRDIGEARIAIDRYLANPAPVVEQVTARTPAKGPAPFLPWIAAGAFALAAAAMSVLYFRAAAVTPPEMRLDIATPLTTYPASFALSPDGTRIAYTAAVDNVSRLWLRALNSTSAQPLAGAEDALNPFWSPDGRSLGFLAGLELKRIDLGGGVPQTLAEVLPYATEATWSPKGLILFSAGPPSLLRVSAAGGQTAPETKLSSGQTAHRAPRFLPGGKQFLFVADGSEPGLWLGSVSGAAPRRLTTITPGVDSPAEYLAPGWLVRVRQNTLVAQRFDTDRGQVNGDPVTLASGVGIDPQSGAGAFSVSPAGVIAWRAGQGSEKQLLWFNRKGENAGVWGQRDALLLNPELSPDGKRVAVTRGRINSADVWIQESARANRFTFSPADDRISIWSPDGTRIVFASTRGESGTEDLYLKPASGAAGAEVLLHSADTKFPLSWSPDSRFILYWSNQNNGDLMILPLTGDRKPFPFLSTAHSEDEGAFSPDGKWVAYESNESGRYEIYVRPFPGPGAQSQVSMGGGISPRWRADGKELYFIAPDAKLMAAPVAEHSDTFSSGVPQALFQTHITMVPDKQQYDVTRDGRFLILSDLQSASSEPIHLLLNWKPPGK